MDNLICYYFSLFAPTGRRVGVVDASCTLYAMVEPWLIGPSADLRTGMNRVRQFTRTRPAEFSLECVRISCAVTRNALPVAHARVRA
jgi:hypothetical protein